MSVLEDAFRHLRPFISVGQQAAKDTQMTVPSGTIPLENRFAHLTVEDIVEIAENEGVTEEDLPAVIKVVFEQDNADIEEELRFAIGIFLQELQSIRNTASVQWKKYKANEVDLIVAAMSTDIAIRLAQKAEADFDMAVQRPTIPVPHDWKKIEKCTTIRDLTMLGPRCEAKQFHISRSFNIRLLSCLVLTSPKTSCFYVMSQRTAPEAEWRFCFTPTHLRNRTVYQSSVVLLTCHIY